MGPDCGMPTNLPTSTCILLLSSPIAFFVRLAAGCWKSLKSIRGCITVHKRKYCTRKMIHSMSKERFSHLFFNAKYSSVRVPGWNFQRAPAPKALELEIGMPDERM